MALIDIDDTLTGYRADPPGPIRGGLIVIHEIWGLVDHVCDIADRFAAEGYLVIAPDLLSGIGIVPDVGLELEALVFSADDQTRADAQPVLRDRLAPTRAPEFAAWAVGALTRVVDYLAEQTGVEGRIAVTGFCFGGGYAFALAGADPRLRAAVSFYGRAPAGTALKAITCPVLAYYGDRDASLMATLPDVAAALEAVGVDFTARVYPGVGHAFFNDTNAATYDADAAEDAWARTLSFLDRRLNAG